MKKVVFYELFMFEDRRRKAKYYPMAFSCWRAMYPVYQYIAKKYDKNMLCEMVYDFSKANADALEKGVSEHELLKNDKFIELFAEDEKYELLKEVSRYICWKNDCIKNKVSTSEVFAFDINACESGKEIEEFSEALCVATSYVSENGKQRIKFKKMM